MPVSGTPGTPGTPAPSPAKTVSASRAGATGSSAGQAPATPADTAGYISDPNEMTVDEIDPDDAIPVRRDGAPDDHDDADADDHDEANEEIQDYRGFAAMLPASAKSAARKPQISSQSIRKGEKDFEEHGTRAQRDALEQSRAVMEDVLAHTRVVGSGAAGDVLRGWLFPDAWADEPDAEPEAEPDDKPDNKRRRFAHTRHRVVMVEAERGPMYASVGAVPGRPAWIQGVPKDQQPVPRPGFDRVWLLPEEALFMVERGSLELWWPLVPIEDILAQLQSSTKTVSDEAGVPLSLQAAYALLIGPDEAATGRKDGTGSTGSTGSKDGKGAKNDKAVEASRGRVPLTTYQVYTHLRRCGYQVLRAVRTDPQTPLDASSPAPKPLAAPAPNLWQWLASLASWAGLGPVNSGTSDADRPLLAPGTYRSYNPIYEQLKLSQPPPVPTPAADTDAAASPFRVVFHVWKAGKKGAAPFSKTRPPPPDFYMAVADAYATVVPSHDQIAALLASVPPLPAAAVASNPQPPSASFPPLPTIYRRLKSGRRCVIVAIVHHGIVNYMRFADGTFAAEPLHPRFDDVAAGKFAGRGGGKHKGRGGKKPVTRT